MKTIFRFLYFASAALFVIYFLGVQWYNRTSYEDHFYLCQTIESGPVGTFLYFYETWCGRWSGRMILGIMYWLATFFTPHKVFFFTYLLVCSFLVLSTFFFVKTFLRKNSDSPIDTIYVLASSILMCGLFYFGTFAITDNWYWTISAIPGLIYLTCSIVLATYCIENNWSTLSILVFAFCSAIIGGGSESFSIPIAVGIFGLLIWRFKLLQWNFSLFFLGTANRALLFGLILLSMGLMIHFTSPGVTKRIAAMTQAFLANPEPQRISDIKKYNPDWSPILFDKRNRMWLLFLIPLGFAALSANVRIGKKHIEYLIFALMAFACCLWGVMYFTFKGTGPPRLWFPVSILISILALVILYFILGKMNLQSKVIQTIKVAAFLLLPIQLTRGMYAHFPKLSTYATQYDLRIAQLVSHQQSGDSAVVMVNPLPEKVLVISAELDADSQKQINKKFACSLNLDFEIGVNFDSGK